MSADGGSAHWGDAGGPQAVTEIGVDLVAAARAGDRRAAEELIAAHLPMLYRIVGRALDGHADVDDVVQETVLRVHRDLPGLRAPESFRSWLIAITMRQISSRLRLWQRERDRIGPLDDAARIPDPEAEFADVTLLRIALSTQRRQISRAVGWLDPDDQELAALWWRELAGGTSRPEVTATLGVGAAHARVRIQRMRHQLELCRRLVAALEARPSCPGLEALSTDWNGTPSSRWRKRFVRHLRGCPRCGPAGAGMVPMERLLPGAGALLLPFPTGGLDLLTTAGGADPLHAGGSGGRGWFARSAGAKVAAVVVAGTAFSATTLTTLPDLPFGAGSTTAERSSKPAAGRSDAPGAGRGGPGPGGTGSSTEQPGSPAGGVGQIGVPGITAGSRVVIRPADGSRGIVDLAGDELVIADGTPGAALSVTAGLADRECLSLRYADGRYVRHASFRLRLSEPEDSLLFREDATFCARPVGETVRFSSFNYPERSVRVLDGRLGVESGEADSTFLVTGS